jgi:hypothetical protein
MSEIKNPEIIDSNGQKYRIGYDEYGYFCIEAGEYGPDGEFHVWGDDDPDISPSHVNPTLSRNATKQLAEKIAEGP